MSGETDLALRVIVTRPFAELVGAVLMDKLGPFAEEPVCGGPGDDAGAVAMMFYPSAGAVPTDAEIMASLPAEARDAGLVRLERQAVSRDWIEGWKDHFPPVVIGRVRVRPPWEPPLEGAALAGATAAGDEHGGGAPLVEVVINPGLGFGTGLHPTTRGTLRLLQHGECAAQGSEGSLGPLVDAGTGSGILAIAAAKLGWGPVVAFDNDLMALASARENVAANGVGEMVAVHEAGVAEVPAGWFAGATVVANLTLDPVLGLLRRLGAGPSIQTGAPVSVWPAPGDRPRRLVVSGILAGVQEQEVEVEARRCGFSPGRRLYETEWVSMELLPAAPPLGDAAGATRERGA